MCGSRKPVKGVLLAHSYVILFKQNNLTQSYANRALCIRTNKNYELHIKYRLNFFMFELLTFKLGD